MNLKIIVLSASVLFSIVLFLRCDRPRENNKNEDGLPPAVPVGLNLYSAGDGEILIEWRNNSEADLKGYNVYKSIDDTQFVNITFTTDNYFFDDSLAYDSTYLYRISAVDIWERESSLSPEISARPVNKYPPEAPRYVDVNARNWMGDESVFLSWQPNIETDIAGYNIYRNTFSSFTADSTSLIGYSNKENWSDTVNLSQLTIYYYKIRAVDKGGLLSNESLEAYGQILKMPEIVFPGDDGAMSYYGNFRFTAAGAPAVYKIIVQSNIILGTLWEKEISSNLIDDTLEVQFDYPYAEPNKEYYWRIASYSGSTGPNSVTKLYKFKIRP
ncbi:MAG: fibronectin type III domain-containing protein [Ignavibacteria bacterium]